MARLDWKRYGAGLGIWVGITAALFACSGDDSTTPGADASPDGTGDQDASKHHDGGSEDASTVDSSKKKDAASGDEEVTESSTDDASDNDVTDQDVVTPPPALNLCTTFDAFWNISETGDAAATSRSTDTAWPAEILNGPPPPDPNATLIGYLNVGDCTVGGVYSNGIADATNWQNALTEFEYNFFGCKGFTADAGVGFALVPPMMQGQPFSPADLKKLGDWFVQSVIQAVANQSADNAEAMLTGAQIDQIQAQMTYQESLYSNINSKKKGFTYSTCTPDAGSD
jgi:hypothetical protein